jgi:DNA-binding Lrp family transcriptional regulator
MDAFDLSLLNGFQRDFPLVARPFATVAERLGCGEARVLERLRALKARGAVSRVGAVVTPRRIGASTLAALSAPPGRLARVAEQVSALSEVNHNYEREHSFNLWFVLAAGDARRLAAALQRIRDATGCPLISLPLQEEFHIDLGFDLCGGRRWHERSPDAADCRPVELGDAGRRLMAALEDGLELVPRPFARLALRSGLTEDAVLAQLEDWLAARVLKRFGVVVRHHELGFTANAMAVWDVPDADVSAVGRRLAAEPGVTLCYRRARSLPDWPYNLFCMVHGQRRDEVEERVAAIRSRQGLDERPHALLFSRRRFKQTGARYLSARVAAHG